MVGEGLFTGTIGNGGMEKRDARHSDCRAHGSRERTAEAAGGRGILF
ncbi:hypothetical protein TGS27_2997 [Geobacillus stearothermophilus]|nr:hypothetical protein TGS27_2997 [Geobacillus stearothermophilus]